MNIQRTLDRIYYPFWCLGNPLDCKWPDARGPAGFLNGSGLQEFPSVGLFNLVWLMLDSPDFSQRRRAKDRAVLDLVIFELQHEQLNGVSLCETAALNSLEGFYLLVRRGRFPSKKTVAAACRAKLALNCEP